jgi:hypothetical protein
MNRRLPLREHSCRSRVARRQSRRKGLIENTCRFVSKVAHPELVSNQDPTLFTMLRTVFTSFVRRLTNPWHAALPDWPIIQRCDDAPDQATRHPRVSGAPECTHLLDLLCGRCWKSSETRRALPKMTSLPTICSNRLFQGGWVPTSSTIRRRMERGNCALDPKGVVRGVPAAASLPSGARLP